MERKTKAKLRKPVVKKGVAKIERIESYYEANEQTDDYIITFRSYKWDIFTVFVNGSKTDKTEKNPNMLSRMEQLGFGNDFVEGDYVLLDIAYIIVGKTGYEKDGELVPHTTRKNKKERLEIVSVKTSSKETFDEMFRDFIASEYENEIEQKVSANWTFNDCLDFFMRKHRNDKNKDN